MHNIFFLIISFSVVIFTACTKKLPEKPDLSAYLDIDKNFKFPAGFVPDPGAEGKKTLLGIDSDRDGVRDDIQRWIFARHPDSEPKRNALRQVAKVFQHDQALMEEESMMEAAKLMDRAIQCVLANFPENEGYSGNFAGELLEAKQLNTVARIRRFLANDLLLDRKVLRSYPMDGTACEK